MTTVHYELEMVTGGLPKPFRKQREGSSQRYWPLFEQLYLVADTGYFDDPDHWVSIARYGGVGTAASNKKTIQNDKTKVPPAPAGWTLRLAARTVAETDADGKPIKSRLYGRLDRAKSD